MDSDWMRSSTWIADFFDNSYVLVDQTLIELVLIFRIPRSDTRVRPPTDLGCLWSLNTGPLSRFTPSRSPRTIT